jgi:adenosylcobinamide kinase/adenosylcobinamide-phosphate guanylyltransferase
MAVLTLVLGGVRSGKSRFAESLARSEPRVIYLATSQPGDAEMMARIAVHRQRRAPQWQTVEEPWDVAAALAAVARPVEGQGPKPCVLLECVSLWLTNLLLGVPGRAALNDEAIAGQVDALLEVVETAAGRLIVVSSEVGCGLLPANALARRFGDRLGEANQRLAAVAAEVYVCLAGIPVQIK